MYNDYHIELSLLVLQILASLIAGFFGAIAGGGGFITLPTILISGIPPHIALGTNKMLAAFTTIPSAGLFINKGIFKPRLWYPAMFAASFGTVIGVVTVQLISSAFLTHALPLLIILAALFVYFSKFDNIQLVNQNFKPALLTSIASSLVLGFYSGFLGAGIGVFWTSTVIALYKLDMIEAIGVARVMCFITNVTAFVLFALYGDVNYALGLIMGITMALGSYMGARMAIKFGTKIIKPIILLMSIAMAASLLLRGS